MQHIGRYRIDGEIGRGATGVVYLAEDPNLRRRLAIKVYNLPEGLGPDEERATRERFLREAQAAGALNHPAIVTVYDADEEPVNRRPYIAMEHVDGSSLREVIRLRGPLPHGEALRIAISLADALSTAHEAGVVHRDIKPANILVRASDGSVKLADFGIARLSSSDLTRTGETLGSPAYMSPEQFRGAIVDGRSDLFSLAVVLYEMLCGEKPFSGTDLGSLAYAIVHETPVPVSRREPRLPAGIDGFFERALAKQPDRRFPDGASFGEALRRILASATKPSPAPVDPGATLVDPHPFHPIGSSIEDARGISGSRHRLVSGVAAGALVLIASALFWFLGNRSALLLEGRNSLEIGELTLIVDGEEVYSRPLGADRKEARLFGKKLFEYGQEQYEARIGVSPGRHEVLARVMAGHGGSVYQDSAIVVVEPGRDLRMKLITAGSAISLKINQEE